MKNKSKYFILKSLWEIFEKTGCISAYLLYKEFNKKIQKNKQLLRKIKVKNLK